MYETDNTLAVIETILRSNKIFGDLLTPNNISFLLCNSLVRPAEPGEILCQQGQIDRTLYLIIYGEVEISALSEEKETILGTLGTGEIIGEISALYMMPRIATATVTLPSIVLEIPGQLFSNMLRDNQALQHAVLNRCENRILETSLRCVPVFSDLDRASMDELIYLSTLMYVNKDVVVAHEGKKERSMYVICSGIARVYITTKERDVTIAILHPGDYFGEFTFFTGEARSASVSALTDLQLVVLEGESFHSFIEYNEDAEYQITLTSSQRQHKLAQMRDSFVARHAAEIRINQVRNMLSLDID